MLRRLELSEDDHRHLIRYARDRHIDFLSTPFDRESAAFLDRLGVMAFKIGSGDLTDRFLLSHVARTERPLLLSTGGATLTEVSEALAVVEANGNPPVALLHCVSTYPAGVENVNLRAMDALRREFQRPVGFSDHTPDRLAPVLAVAIGACIVEKHLTLSRALAGPDHAFSLEPSDFALMVSDIRRAERAMGSGRKEPQPGEAAIMGVARKSLFSARRIEQGDVITEEDVVALRPAGGISPMQASAILGRVAALPIDRGVMLRLDMVRETRQNA
jgi:N,N'-diacetyllegionaminate synthase